MRSLLSLLVLAAASLAQEVPAGLSASDWGSIRAAYEAGRHRMFAEDGGHRAHAPHQQWSVHFDGRGFAVEPDVGGWSWGLELVAYGFAGAERPVATAPPARADGQRLTYRRDEGLDEWYHNGPGGLEHGYTLHHRPAGDGTLTFLLRVRGELSPVVQNRGTDVVFERDGATVVSYTGLHVFDADGETLPARFTVQSQGLLLSIDERSARYPVTIDPVAQHAYLKASNTDAGDLFGSSVAVSGGTVVVGARGESSGATGINGNQGDDSAAAAGAAYVFVRSGGGWSLQAYLKASNTDASDFFGDAVAISGDTIVVGARGEDSNATGVNGSQSNDSASLSGAAYVFVRNGSTWSQQAYLKASNTGTSDQFGIAVAVSGDTVVVGASTEDSNATGIDGNGADNSASGAGAAYVFVRSGTTWSQQAYLKASNTGSGDVFGEAVAISGDTIVVGAEREDSSATGIAGNGADNGAGDAGAAYVFVRNGTTWSQQAYLKASNTDAGDFFGDAVAVSGDTVVVGARGEGSAATGINGNQADDSAAGAGAAYVFVRNGAVWSQQAYLKASNTNALDSFGGSVAMSGDTIVVGATGEDSSATGVDGRQADDSASGAGAAYVFARSGGTWSQVAYLKASNTDASDFFGAAVAVSNDTVVVGANAEDSGAFASAFGVTGSAFDDSAVSAGSVYVFDLRSGGIGSIPAPAQRAYLKASNTDSGDLFGVAVAVSGDTVVVGANGEDSSGTGVNSAQVDNLLPSAGAAYVFVRNGTTWSQQAFVKASNTNTNDRFGSSVAVSGNTMVIGAPFEASSATGIDGNPSNNAAPEAGAAYVFVRNGTTWSQQAYLKASNAQANDRFGTSVAVAGDTIVIGAGNEDSSATGVNGNQANNSAGNAGAAYVFVRNGSTWSQQAYLKASNTGTSDGFGERVAVSGDTVVVGANAEDSNATAVNGNQASNSASDAGAAYVFVRSGTTWSQQAYLKASNTEANDRFGNSVAVCGDTIVVGAYFEASSATGIDGNQSNNAAPAAGAAYVFVRNGTSWSQQAYLKASNAGADDYFGVSVAVSGDTAVVGAHFEASNATGTNGNQANNSAWAAGAAYVFTRCGTSWTQRAYLKASNSDADDFFGGQIALSGDTVVVGAVGEDSSASTIDGLQSDDSALNAGAAYVFDTSRLRPSLWPLNEPQLGSTYTLALDNLDPTFSFAILTFGFVQLPLPGVDLGPVLGMPCCDLYHFPDILVTAPLGAGGSTSWDWVPVSGAPGDLLYCQALCLDPAANAFGFTLSNQITIELVP